MIALARLHLRLSGTASAEGRIASLRGRFRDRWPPSAMQIADGPAEVAA